MAVENDKIANICEKVAQLIHKGRKVPLYEGIVLKNPSHEQRAEYGLAHRQGEGSGECVYTNLYPDKILSIRRGTDDIYSIRVPDDYPQGGGEYSNKQEVLDLLAQHKL